MAATYRRLNQEELQSLRTEFTQFLASNTVTANDWVTLKKDSPEKAEGLIDLFSDIVFEKTLDKIQYLQHRTPDNLRIFECGPEKMIMLGLYVEGSADLDFTKPGQPAEMLQKLRTSNAKLKMYQAEKAYNASGRKKELFKMMEEGCLISDGRLYQALKGMRG